MNIKVLLLISVQALTPPIRLYPPNAGPILPGMLGPAALGTQANVAAVAAGASAAAIQAAYDSSSELVMHTRTGLLLICCYMIYC